MSYFENAIENQWDHYNKARRGSPKGNSRKFTASKWAGKYKPRGKCYEKMKLLTTNLWDYNH